MWKYMNIAKMTGFEIMQVIVREELPHPTMTKSIPVKVMKAEKWKVVFNAIVNNKHLNTQCGVHGGFVSTVLDSITEGVLLIPFCGLMLLMVQLI